MRKFSDGVLRHALEATAGIIRWRRVRFVTMAGNQQELSVDNASFTEEDRAQLDRIDEARETIELLEQCRPEEWNVGNLMRAYEKMCANPGHGKRWLEGFRKAGLDI